MSYRKIEDIAALEALYGAPGEPARIKVTDRLTPAYRAWIERARFCVVSTVGPEGTDGSPRGDSGPVVRIEDDRTLLLPDWHGNNRIDTLRNVVRDGRISLMFMVPGSHNVMRVNGSAYITDAPEALTLFEVDGKHPRTVMSIDIREVYSQCARAVMRAGLWNGSDAEGLPSVGDMLREVRQDFDGAAYDRNWHARAKDTMW
ncbi:MAG: pyridoxamine 5'-phosphate oxidase [Rhodobacterales bacterium]|nr:MAG: pyridoxamine 5'-phosphate oxidase [Rhodobacterales bacterium]